MLRPLLFVKRRYRKLIPLLVCGHIGIWDIGWRRGLGRARGRLSSPPRWPKHTALRLKKEFRRAGAG